MKHNSVAVIGAGWSGATTARILQDAGLRVEVFEKLDRVGGHSRVESMRGVVFEPNGPHIFHTSDEGVVNFVRRFGMARPYQHCVLTEVFISDERWLLTWPPQIDELSRLPNWQRIERELEGRPAQPDKASFESHVISLMGETLYRLLVFDYTRKHWACDPGQLSWRLAPKRVEMRADGNRRLFRDRWEFFPSAGVNSVIENVLDSTPVHLSAEITLDDCEALSREFDALVITAPLDLFEGGESRLAWRGVTSKSSYYPTGAPGGTRTEAYIINRPSPDVPYTRTVETKHASGQEILGTVVSEEYPEGDSRHYPVMTVDGQYERINEELKGRIREVCPIPVFFCGRLANYLYINQDEAIRQAMDTASDVIRARGEL
jgi:UDP-galactopyranose mutase